MFIDTRNTSVKKLATAVSLVSALGCTADPMAVRSKALICSRLIGTAGSNTARGLNACVTCLFVSCE